MLPSVLVISSVRLYLVVKGQWAADGSWYYNPMLILETSEVGGTLLALSVPALKPLLGSWATTIIGPLSAGPAASGQTGKTTPYGSNARRRSWMRSSKPRSDVMTPTGVPYDYELSSKNAANGTGTEVSPSKYSDEALLNQPGLSTYDDRDETVRSNGQPVQAITVIKEFSTH